MLLFFFLGMKTCKKSWWLRMKRWILQYCYLNTNYKSQNFSNQPFVEGKMMGPSVKKKRKAICCILYYSRIEKIKNSAINGGISNYVGSAGKNSNTSRTVVLIVVPSAVISVMLITFICCLLKRRRTRESVGSKLNTNHTSLTLPLAIEIIMMSENDKRQLFSINNFKIKALISFTALSAIY